MDQVVPWEILLTLIEPHYPTSGRFGRPPYALATMLRIHRLLQSCALGDSGMEEAPQEIASIHLFDRLSGLDAIPDKKTTLSSLHLHLHLRAAREHGWDINSLMLLQGDA